MPMKIDTNPPFPTPVQLGYDGARRHIAFWWEPGVDELAMYDGQRLTVGFGNHWGFLDWLRAVGYPELELGVSENESKNCILVDTEKNEAYLCPLAETQDQLRNKFMTEQMAFYNHPGNMAVIVDKLAKLTGAKSPLEIDPNYIDIDPGKFNDADPGNKG